MSAAVLRSEAEGMRGAEPERKPPLSGRGGKPVSDDSRRWNGAPWKSLPVEWFTGGTGMERSGDGLNGRSQARKRADVSLQNLEAQARRHENRKRRILRRLIGGRGRCRGCRTWAGGAAHKAWSFLISTPKAALQKKIIALKA